MAKEHPDVLFAAVTQDKDEGDTICTAAGVESFPTIRFYAHGKKVGEVNGADPAACQRKIKALKSKMPPHPTYEESEEDDEEEEEEGEEDAEEETKKSGGGGGGGCATGAALLTKTDESVKTPGLFLVGSLVVHGDLSFCFVYKFRQRFGVVADAIAKGLGMDTKTAVASCREMNMFLDDFECCKAACGETC